VVQSTEAKISPSKEGNPKKKKKKSTLTRPKSNNPEGTGRGRKAVVSILVCRLRKLRKEIFHGPQVPEERAEDHLGAAQKN